MSLSKIFQNDPFSKYYNLEKVEHFSLSCDIDWAPEYAVADLFSIVADSGFDLTAFATHPSYECSNPPDFVEIGLHPDNTRPHPEFGLSRKILDLKELYPDAIGVRAHRNFFGQNIADFASKAGLVYDASVFTWQQKFAQIHKDQFGLWRMNYIWEDGVNADMGLEWDLKNVPIDGPGLKIFNFHPIFIYLNCPNDDYRRKIVANYRNLQDAPKAQMEPNIYKGYGARSFMIDLLRELKNRNLKSIGLAKMFEDK